MSVLEGIATAALDALRFLTRLPLPRSEAVGGDVFPESAESAESATHLPEAYRPHPWTMALFPAVGLLLGAVLWSLDAALGRLLPQGSLDLLLLAALALLSGAIHWDGLIDTADALGVPKTRRRAVLRDVHAGSFGVLALVLVLAVQWSALGALSGWIHGASLLLFPLWGRWLMLAVTWNMPDMRRGGGLAGSFLARLNGIQVAVSGLFSLLISTLLLGWFNALAIMLVMGALAPVLRGGYRRGFDGISGDLIGAACCLGEALALLTLSALAR